MVNITEYFNSKYNKEYGVNISRYALSGMLPAMKRERLYAWLKDAHSQVLQSALLHLDTAFKNFFQKRAKFPRFKKKSGKQSCQYPQGVKIKDTLIFIPKSAKPKEKMDVDWVINVRFRRNRIKFRGNRIITTPDDRGRNFFYEKL